MQISTILDQIDLGSMALPEFQRGYVWNRDQVRKFMRSLYRGYPVGSLLVWETKTEQADARGEGPLATGTVKLLLDGQQRVTSLYGMIRGEPPKFFDGNKEAFTGLYFHLDDEEFEFYAFKKMQNNPLWINVTELMRSGVGFFIKRLIANPDLQPKIQTYINRLNAIENIKSRVLHIENVTGEDKHVDVVVDIFNEVNSGGTKLSQGDLALAKVCAAWPDARSEMKKRLEKWSKAGFYFKLDWLMRCITTTVTGQAYFSSLKDVTTLHFSEGLLHTEKYVDTLLNLIASRLGLDHDRVLGSRYSFPLLVRYLAQREGQLGNHIERDKLLFWYIHTFLWGRYAGSTESTLAKDLAAIEQQDSSLDKLIDQLHQNRGDLRLYARDFEGANVSARFYPMLYMMTRVCRAKDWETGIDLTGHLLGKLSTLQVHHIFPKALLYKYGYGRQEVNAIANFTFLTQETNLMVSDHNPVEYLEYFAHKNPGAVESHWIPMDRNLWRVERYFDFLTARRELLAQTANNFLESLLVGAIPETQVTPSVLDREVVMVPGSVASEEEQTLLDACNGWVVNNHLPEGEYQYELVDDATKEPLAILDLAWPEGLQKGKSTPVAVLIDEGQATIQVAQRMGYRCFTSADLFRDYVVQEILTGEFVIE